MSNIYHTEPPTNGKVVLRTSFGDIDIELWPKEAPLACRNFIQLALEGYYDKTIVNRVIKDFMIQMGDPSGTGKGGESVWGRPFKDEVHGRIKFNHRGQVAMANENKPNTNQSQFFITLGPCDWLDRKHTIFGKVTGNTFYNVARMGDADVDEHDTPTEKFFINSIEILSNPFDDIAPRDMRRAQDTVDVGSKPKREREGKRDLKLLSFGDEEEHSGSEEQQPKKLRMISAHEDKVKPSSRLVPQVAEELQDIARIAPAAGGDKSEADEIADFNRRMKEKLKEKQRSAKSDTSRAPPQVSAGRADEGSDDDRANSALPEETAASRRKEDFDRLRKETMKSRQAVKVLTGADAQKAGEEVGVQQLITPLEMRRQKFMKRKKEFGSREAETLQRLSAFSAKVRQVKTAETGDGDDTGNSMYAEVYSGQVLDREDERREHEAEGDNVDGSWFTGKLKFRKHVDDAYRSGSDGRQAHDYEVIDPRAQGYGNGSSSTSARGGRY